MRRKPVTRSEIRLTGWVITTLPVDAVGRNDVGDLAPIRKLWEPLLREVNRESKRDYEQKARRSSRLKPWKPTDLPVGRLLQPWPYTCRRCGRQLYRVFGGGSRYCSDVCAETTRREQRAGYNAAMVEARSEARAAARADRRCANPECNEPLPAQRSTRRFCSIRCRVAVHRAGRSPDL